MIAEKSCGVTKTGNWWEKGQVVRVGFMKLRVVDAKAIKDGLPDIYCLKSLDGKKEYRFTPYNGLSRVN